LNFDDKRGKIRDDPTFSRPRKGDVCLQVLLPWEERNVLQGGKEGTPSNFLLKKEEDGRFPSSKKKRGKGVGANRGLGGKEIFYIGGRRRGIPRNPYRSEAEDRY